MLWCESCTIERLNWPFCQQFFFLNSYAHCSCDLFPMTVYNQQTRLQPIIEVIHWLWYAGVPSWEQEHSILNELQKKALSLSLSLFQLNLVFVYVWLCRCLHRVLSSTLTGIGASPSILANCFFCLYASRYKAGAHSTILAHIIEGDCESSV